MLKRVSLVTIVLSFMYSIVVFAGVEWQSKLTETTKGKQRVTTVQTYAQAGNVRQDFIDVKSDDNPFMKKGVYWLYKGDSDKILVVDPKEKTYMEVPMQSMLQAAGALGQMVKITITEPTVEVVQRDKETVSGYECNHLQINTSYAMETKIAIMKIKTTVEQNQEIWATDAIDVGDLAAAFKNKTYRTGMADLDALIEKQMQPYKNLGFVVKSVTTQKNTDKKGKSEITVNQMDVIEVNVKDLNDSLFQIPSDYTRQEFLTPGMGN